MKKENKGKYKIIKKVLKSLFWILVILLIWDIVPAFFYKPEKHSLPLPDNYKKGVYHLHSVFSDGKGTIEEITKSADNLNLDFVILTDHGRPNVKCVNSTSWMNNVLLVGASELSLNCGHMACIGFDNPGYIFPPEPQEAINEIVKDNEGVCFVSHPFDDKIPWTDWDIKDFTGLEIYSSYTEARRAGLLKILVFPLKYMIDSDYALLDTMKYPDRNMSTWDSLNKKADRLKQFYGIYSLDAHAKLPITKSFQLNFPTYESMFRVMTVYVKVGEAFNADAGKAEAQLVAAIKKGRFFNVLEAIAPANGFDAYFLEQQSGQRVEMGGVSREAEGKIIAYMPFDFDTSVAVIKDGKVIKTIPIQTKGDLQIDVKESGVYRLELTVPDNSFDDLPWLVTNPFFVGMRPLAIDDSEMKLEARIQAHGKPFPGDLSEFKVEKNDGSEGVITIVTGEEENNKIVDFQFKLTKDGRSGRDFWSVMALRKQMDLSSREGLAFTVKSSRRMRYWVEFRTGDGKSKPETWYRHSFLATPEWTRIRIPFQKFHPYFGEMKTADMNKVEAVFIGINNQTAYEGTEGVLNIDKIVLY